MDVDSRGRGELAVLLEESARALVVDVLAVLAAVAEEALVHAQDDAQRSAHARRRQIGEIHRQAAESRGPVRVVGEPKMIVEAIRAIASHGAYELDVLLESLAATRAPLDEQAVEQIRSRSAATASAVEALIACEASRRGHED